MSAPRIILASLLPSFCQKLSKLVEIWRSSDKNNFAQFFLRHGVDRGPICYRRTEDGCMYERNLCTMMTSSAGTWRPALTDTALPFPVRCADSSSLPSASRALLLATEPEEAPLNLCKRRRSVPTPPRWSPTMSTTHETTASGGKYSHIVF